jgi:hypothetical protein
MASFSRLFLTALCFLTLGRIVSAAAVPYYFRPAGVSSRNLSIQQIAADLGPQISNGSLIFGPSDARWVEAVHRYNTLSPPDVEFLVEPAQESDISKIVSCTVITRNPAILTEV